MNRIDVPGEWAPGLDSAGGVVETVADGGIRG